MNLRELSEAEFLCDGDRTGDVENPMAFCLGLPLIKELGHQFLHALNSGYELHQLCGQPGDIVLINPSLTPF